MPTVTTKISRILKKQTDLLIVRDFQTYKVFSHFNPVYLTCPAFFSVQKTLPKKELSKVAFTLQGLNSNRIRLKIKDFAHSLEQYKMVREIMGNVDVICHTRKDAEYLHRYIERKNIRMAETVSSLMNVYSEYDSVFSTRLHGCILANSFGIPCFPLHSSNRMGALTRLLGSLPAVNAVDWLRKLDVEKESHRLLKFKESEKKRYLLLLGKTGIVK
jgi:polysaccharide pyruvyl transferase WcaK-like protein